MGDGGRIPWGRLLLGGLFALAIFAVLAVLVGPLLAMQLAGGGNYQVRDNAMAPALLAGDWVLVERIHPGEVPRRGEVVVYDDPANRGRQRIMRVVALPGERVQMRGGALYIDGRRAGMERIAERIVTKHPPERHAPVPHCLNDPVPLNGACRQEIWRETLPDGAGRPVLNSQGQIGVARLSAGASPDDTTLFTVPRGHVFVMGDNRDRAIDSRVRHHGPVPLEKLRYRAWLIHTSLDRSARFPRPRLERFFRTVR